MSTESRRFETTIQAGEDLNTAGHQFHAIALDDKKLAGNGLEASGILLNKPKTGEGLTLAYFGELKFAAGGGISAGGRLTVATSGFFVAASSGDYCPGRAKTTVTSGSVGVGIFNFASPMLKVTSWGS